MKKIHLTFLQYIFTAIIFFLSTSAFAGSWESGGDRRGTIPGDYNLAGSVSIDEVVKAINCFIAPDSGCDYLDFDNDFNSPEINEVILVINSFLEIDEDMDSMIDSWELVHNLNNALDDTALDPDFDGDQNLAEFNMLTDPQSESPLLSIRLVNPEAGASLNVQDVDSVEVEAIISFADTVQLDYSIDGINWQEINIVINPSGAMIAGIWNFGTLSAAPYFVRAVAWDGTGNRSADLRYVTTTNAVPAPVFISPSPDSIYGDQVIKLEISQFLGPQDYSSVLFEGSQNGLDFFKLGEDLDGSDGWSMDLDLNEVELGGLIAKATVTNSSGNTAFTMMPIGKLSKDDVLNPNPTLPVTFIDPPTEITALPQQLQIDVSTFKSNFNITGSIQATLIPHLLDNGVGQSVLQGVSTQQDIISFSLDRLFPGDYHITVFLEALTDQGLVKGYSPVINLKILDDEQYLLPFRPMRSLLTESDFQSSQVESDYTRTLNILREGSGGDLVFRKHTVENVPEIEFGIVDLIHLEQQTLVVLRVQNNQDIPLMARLLMESGYWNELDTAVIRASQEQLVPIEPGVFNDLEVILPGEWGLAEDISFLRITSLEFGEQAQFMANITLPGETPGFLGNQIGTNALFFSNFIGSSYDNFKYPTYHWQRCTKVTDMLPDNANPNLSYEWTVTNTNGKSWKGTGKTLKKHAAILGGPHKVRVVCKANNVEVVTYGSDHYVYNNLVQTGVSFDTGYPKQEYTRNGILTGPNGPAPDGGGEITITESKMVSEKVSITSSVGGSLGEKGIAAVEASIGVTAEQSVSKTTSVGQKYKIPEGKCITVYIRLCFKVWKGKVTYNADGQTIEVPFEAKVLQSVGLEPVVGNCN